MVGTVIFQANHRGAKSPSLKLSGGGKSPKAAKNAAANRNPESLSAIPLLNGEADQETGALIEKAAPPIKRAASKKRSVKAKTNAKPKSKITAKKTKKPLGAKPHIRKPAASKAEIAVSAPIQREQPMQPLPRSNAVQVYRPRGIFSAIGYWLRQNFPPLPSKKLAVSGGFIKRLRSEEMVSELNRLTQENRALRAQLSRRTAK